MKTTNSKTILTIMNVLFWIAFIGLCIETGAIAFNYFFSLFINENATYNLYKTLNLNELYNKDILHYHITMLSYIIISGLKAFIAYKCVKLFKVFKLDKPFTTETTKFVFEICYWTLIAGIFAIFARAHAKWVSKIIQDIPIEYNGNEIIFFSGLLYLIAAIMQKGTQIQEENDLTV